MPDIAQWKQNAILKMTSAGMIHPHTGAEAEANRILDEFAASVIGPDPEPPALKEKRKSDAS